MAMATRGYNPAKRKHCVNSAWYRGRKVRILAGAPHAGKIGIILGVGPERVTIRVPLGKNPGEHDEGAYLPQYLRLIAGKP